MSRASLPYSTIERAMSSRITLLRARVPLPSIHSALNRHASPSTAYPAFKNAHGPTQPQRYASSVERNAAKTLNELPKKDASPSNESANQKKSRFSRFSRFALVSGVVVWVGVEVDKRYNSAAITRSIRTGWMGYVSSPRFYHRNLTFPVVKYRYNDRLWVTSFPLFQPCSEIFRVTR